MALKKLKIAVNYKEEDGVKIPVYKTILVEMEYLRVYPLMQKTLYNLTKPETLLAFYLFNNCDDKGIIYNNRLVKREFNKFLKETLEVEYKMNTIDHAFSNLKKEGLIISCEAVIGAYWINPAFMFKGSEVDRSKIFTEIEDEEFLREIRNQKIMMNMENEERKNQQIEMI